MKVEGPVGTEKITKLRLQLLFLAVNYVFISLCCLLLTAFFFPRADFSFFQGAERTHAAVVNTEKATSLPQSVIKLYYFISCNHVSLTSKWGTVFLSSLEQPKLWCLFPRSMNDHWGERGHQVPCWNRKKKGFKNLGKHETTMKT